MKRILSVLLAAMMLAMLGTTAATARSNNNGLIGMPNPFVKCETMEDAAEVAGFDMTVPAKAAGCKQVWINAVKDNLIQVCYQSKSNEVRIRKARGWQENLDGDYNVYGNTQYKFIAHKLVKERGEDRIFSVLWYSKGYTYSITATNGMKQGSVDKIVKAVQ